MEKIIKQYFEKILADFADLLGKRAVGEGEKGQTDTPMEMQGIQSGKEGEAGELKNVFWIISKCGLDIWYFKT